MPEKNQIGLNHIMSINLAAIKGSSEDTFAYSTESNNTMIAVFDGCGGLGSKRYSNYQNFTAAYLSARIAERTTLRWFNTRVLAGDRNNDWNISALSCTLKKALDEKYSLAQKKLDTDQNIMLGSLIRSFPTTACIGLINHAQDYLNCHFFWAGDSRGYILQPEGLQQCTVDDIRNQADAFDNLYMDSPLSNMVHGDGTYEIHTISISCHKPSIVISASDGCFAYLPSPMHFEWLLLRTLCKANSLYEWQELLENEIAKVSGDDSTMVAAIYGWTDFHKIKADFSDRNIYLERMLCQNSDEEELRNLWEQYRLKYEQYITESGGGEGFECNSNDCRSN